MARRATQSKATTDPKATTNRLRKADGRARLPAVRGDTGRSRHSRAIASRAAAVVVEALPSGDGAQALLAKVVWFYPRIVEFARRWFANRPRPAFDEEDVAQVVFTELWRLARLGRLAEVSTLDALWRFIRGAARQELYDRRRYDLRLKRAGTSLCRSVDPHELRDVAAPQDSGALELAIRIEWEWLEARLPDERLREIAKMRIEGHTTKEIADTLRVTPRTIERRLALIRGYCDRFRNAAAVSPN